jgi:hypothetical protein
VTRRTPTSPRSHPEPMYGLVYVRTRAPTSLSAGDPPGARSRAGGLREVRVCGERVHEQAIRAGETRLLQHIVVAVPDLDAAVDFWTKGLGMKVTRTRHDDAGLRTVFVAYGEESFQVRDCVRQQPFFTPSLTARQPSHVCDWLTTRRFSDIGHG